MNILLASTSTLHGGNYLEYLTEEIRTLYKGITEVLFIPFARPSGISHEDYTAKVREFFSQFGITVYGLHEFVDKKGAVNSAQAYFTGGGNTFLLVKMLHAEDLMETLKLNVLEGKPYLGTSAGSNIAGVTMKTTNDMPIVYPASFRTMGLVPFNINPHYLDADPASKHNGETRETRIMEFHTQQKTKVVGLREGNWIRRIGSKVTTEGTQMTRIFEKGKEPYELSPGSEIL